MEQSYNEFDSSIDLIGRQAKLTIKSTALKLLNKLA